MPVATRNTQEVHSAATTKPRPAVRLVLERYSLLLLVIAVFIFFATWSRTHATFLTAQNLQNVAADQTPLVLVALASLFPLLCGEFDLSAGAVATMSQIAAGYSLAHGTPLPAAVAIGLGIGLVVGGINATLVTRVGVNGIITTLGMATLLTGLVTWRTGGQNIVEGIPEELTSFGSNGIAGIPALTILVVAAGLVVAYVFALTPAGRKLTMIGSNRQAAALVGIGVPKYVGSAFVVSALLASVAGITMLARNGIASPQAGGTALTLQALSAAFLGATAIRPGRFNVAGTFIAISLIAISVAGLSLAGVAGWVSDVFNGAALVVAVAASTLIGRHRTTH